VPRIAFWSAWPTFDATVRTIIPVAALEDLKTIVLRKLCILLVAVGLIKSRLIFLVMNIRDTLEEEQWKHVGFEVSCVYRASQDVRRFPKVGLEPAQTKTVHSVLTVPVCHL
jgi:hypothetical protein